jgi:hypothetical protein
MFTIRCEDRAYDCHRPVPCTVLCIEDDAWPGNEFGLWLPETVLLAGEVVRGNWLAGGQTQAWQQEGDTWRWTYAHAAFTLCSTLAIDQAHRCLWYTHAFTNTGTAALDGLNTKTCFHMMNAPRFIAKDGERYWAKLDGAWTTTDRVPRHLSPDPRRVKFLRAGDNPERQVIPQYGFPAAVMPQEAHHPLFLAESFDGADVVGIACRDMAELFNNNDYILRCLHSEPLPLAPLAPGATAAQEGVILFGSEGREALLVHFARLTVARW